MNFSTLTSLTDRDRIHSFLSRHQVDISELTFTNLFAWRHTRPVYYAFVQDFLTFYIDQPGHNQSKKLLFGPPVGKEVSTGLLTELSEHIAGAVRIPKRWRGAFDQAGLSLTPDRNNADYIYLVDDLANLPGRKYAKKRNHIKQCLKNYDCSFETITPDNLEECRTLQDRWCQVRGCRDEPGLNGEYEATRETLHNYESLDLLGGAIRINSTIEAFAIGERLNSNTAVCHFEKAMPGFHGLAQLITKWFPAHCLKSYKYINREQDLGIKGLRQAKESYHPDHLLEKFSTPLPSSGPSPLEVKYTSGQ